MKVKEFLADNFKFIIFLAVFGLVGGYFTALYSVEALSPEILEEALSEIGSIDLLVIITTIQSLAYAVVLGLVGKAIAERIGLWRRWEWQMQGMVSVIFVVYRRSNADFARYLRLFALQRCDIGLVFAEAYAGIYHCLAHLRRSCRGGNDATLPHVAYSAWHFEITSRQGGDDGRSRGGECRFCAPLCRRSSAIDSYDYRHHLADSHSLLPSERRIRSCVSFVNSRYPLLSLRIAF